MTTRSDGYNRLSIFGHWISAILIVALFLTHEGDRGGIKYFVHVSFGAVAGLFLMWRVWHRARAGMTNKPDQPALLNLVSQIVMWGLLAATVVVVITGYLLPWTRGAPLDVLGLFDIPSPIAAHYGFHEFVEEVHDVSGHAFLPLVGLHIVGALKHAFWDRDGIAARMFKPVSGGK